MALKNTFFSFNGTLAGGKGMVFMLCVLSAAVIWLLNALSKNYVSTYEYSVLSGKDQSTSVTVTLNGQGFDLLKLYYRLNNRIVNSNRFHTVVNCRLVTDSLIGDLKNRVRIQHVEPLMISGASITGQKIKRVPVISRVNLSCASQYGLALPLMLKPDSIDIAGAPQEVEKINFIETAPLAIFHLDKSLFRSVSLTMPKGDIWLSQQKVWMYAYIERYTEARFSVPVIYNGLVSRVRLVPEYVTLTCQVPLSRYSNLKPEMFVAEAKAGATNSSSMLSVQVTTKPYYATNVSVSPEEVSILIFE